MTAGDWWALVVAFAFLAVGFVMWLYVTRKE